MNKRLLAILAVTIAASVQPITTQAQQRQIITNLKQRVDAPSYSDLYCSGFLTKTPISGSSIIMGGEHTPHATLYAKGDTIFLSGGTYQEGTEYSIVRELRDPNRRELFKGQHAVIMSTGDPYDDIGRVKVQQIRGNVAVATVEYSCQSLTIGDIVVPFQEKPQVSYRPVTQFVEFPAEASRVSGRIVMGREFDSFLGTGQKVYVNLGAGQGLKAGDYLRVVQSYDPSKMDEGDSLSYKAPSGDDTQKHPLMIKAEYSQKLPRRAVGEMIVLSVTPTSATAMITSAYEGIQIGDTVELEEGH